MIHNHALIIKYPHDHDKRTWSTTVIGRSWCKDEKIQAMVKAADDVWYPQPQVCYEPWGYFSVKVLLGFKEDPNAVEYPVVVGVGGEKVLGPVKELPEDVLWTKVTVERI